jgi:hypothetical protein
MNGIDALPSGPYLLDAGPTDIERAADFKKRAEEALSSFLE